MNNKVTFREKTASNIRGRIHKTTDLGFVAGSRCDFWVSEWRQLISSSDDTGPYTSLISPLPLKDRPETFSFLALRPALLRFHCNRLLDAGKQHLAVAVICANILTVKHSSGVNKQPQCPFPSHRPINTVYCTHCSSGP